MIVAPFIRKDTLATLVGSCKNPTELSVITRWTGVDIATGIADLEIYPYLRSLGIPLYLNQAIHLKLLVFLSNWAFVTSGNVTAKGMGLTRPCNVEVGCQVKLGPNDWRAIYGLLGDSFRVDDNLHAKAVCYKNENSQIAGPLPALDLAPPPCSDFSVLSLPATENPTALRVFYACRERIPVGSILPFMHDITHYGIPPGLETGPFYDQLRSSFTGHPFTKAIIAFIEEKRSVRFGGMSEWLQSNCSDRPTPYRWELKSSTRRLYDWLDYFYDEITWDRPNHSQVIRWHSKPS
jgi:hypothetical protein